MRRFVQWVLYIVVSVSAILAQQLNMLVYGKHSVSNPLNESKLFFLVEKSGYSAAMDRAECRTRNAECRVPCAVTSLAMDGRRERCDLPSQRNNHRTLHATIYNLNLQW